MARVHDERAARLVRVSGIALVGVSSSAAPADPPPKIKIIIRNGPVFHPHPRRLEFAARAFSGRVRESAKITNKNSSKRPFCAVTSNTSSYKLYTSTWKPRRAAEVLPTPPTALDHRQQSPGG